MMGGVNDLTSKTQGRKRNPVALAASGLGVMLLLALAYSFLRPSGEVPRPVVLISSPDQGQQVLVGQEVTLHAVARGQARIVRAELWVDGQLREVQRSGVPNGTSPLPLVASWRPTTPGQHTLVARAFDASGGRSNATVTVEAVERTDRDSDGILDGDDQCPDQPGWDLTKGCPDRDGDAIVDAEDACREQAGTIAGKGCPQPVEGDRDGDGVADSADASPDEAGSAALDGRPLPTPSTTDTPSAETTASPLADADGDGVADDRDLCPEAAGPPAAGGCPASGAGDRDSDGVADDVDLAPEEPGLPEHGGCPPPGEGRDGDGSGIPDEEELPRASLGETLMLLRPFQMAPAPKAPVEFEILEFGTHQAYDEVACYVRLNDSPAQRGELGYTGGLSWDVDALGGARRGILDVPDGEAARVHVECGASRFRSIATEGDLGDGRFGGGGSEATYYDLGTLDAVHTAEEWDGRRLFSVSVRDAEPVGRVFHMAYRICEGSCGESPYPAPRAALRRSSSGSMYVTWEWDGDESRIDRFTLRGQCRGGAGFTRAAPPDARAVAVDSIGPACGESCSYWVAAESHANDLSSPNSNVVVWDGEPCPGTLCVDFGTVTTAGQSDTSICGRGPILGQLWANDKVLSFDAAGRFWLGEDNYTGLDVPDPASTGNCHFNIQTLFDSIHVMQHREGGDAFSAPASSQVCIPMHADSDLTVGLRIMEAHAEGEPTTLIESSGTIPAAHLMGDDFNRHFESYVLYYDRVAGLYRLWDDKCYLYFRLYWQGDRPETR